MGLATHLGPWTLGTVKDTTGATVGLVRNLGPTIVAQTFKKDYTGVTVASPNASTICFLPAGAQIIDINVDTLTAFTGSTAANLTIGDGTTANLFFTTTDITAQGRAAVPAAVYAAWCGVASTAAPNGIGIGPTDVKVVATLSPTVATVTAGLVQFTIVYSVHLPDGTYVPTSSTV